MEKWQAKFFDKTVEDIMTCDPKTVSTTTKITETQRIMHRHKVWMADSGGQLCLAHEALHVLRLLLRDMGIEYLERKERVKHQMPHEPDGSKAAHAKQPLHLVSLEVVSGPHEDAIALICRPICRTAEAIS